MSNRLFNPFQDSLILALETTPVTALFTKHNTTSRLDTWVTVCAGLVSDSRIKARHEVTSQSSWHCRTADKATLPCTGMTFILDGLPRSGFLLSSIKRSHLQPGKVSCPVQEGTHTLPTLRGQIFILGLFACIYRLYCYGEDEIHLHSHQLLQKLLSITQPLQLSFNPKWQPMACTMAFSIL